MKLRQIAISAAILAVFLTVTVSSSAMSPFAPTASSNPIGYFTFASDANIVLKQNLAPIAKELGGNLMIGGDASFPDVSSEFIQVMRKANSLGAQKHVYLEGPGGPTGSSGIAGDECKRMIARAKGVGIVIDRNNCSNSAKWIKKWNATGWWDSTIREIRYFYKNFGATSFEIDNLYRAGVESSDSVVEFVRNFQGAMQANNLPATLLLKNLTVADLNAVRADIQGQDPERILRTSLTDFMISEEDFRSQWTSIAKAAQKIGVKMLKSTDTYNYQARGYFAK